MIIKIKEKILDLIYPQVCGNCGKINVNSLCNKCKAELEKEFKFEVDDYLESEEKNFIEHYYFFKYQELIRKHILSLKFQEKPYIYKTISFFLENKQKKLYIALYINLLYCFMIYITLLFSF